MDNKNVILVSCDSKYYMDHTRTLIRSCIDHGQHIHVHVVNPTDRVHEIAEKDANQRLITYTHERSDKSDRTYYACNRFLILPKILKRYPENRYLVIDADSFLLKPFPFPDKSKEVGIFLRDNNQAHSEWEKRGMRIAAGIVFADYRALPFAQNVADRIEQLGTNRWFTDQIALREAYDEYYSDKQDKVFHFELKYCDWEFHNDSYMWSGKGPRKNSNQQYLKMKELIGE